jgi:TetR/AcrR family transcriptional regulator
MARPKANDPKARGRIIKAAEELFAARGYAGTPIRDIAEAARVNPAMVHYYFGNKEGLYHQILENAAAEVRAELLRTAASGASAEERLAGFISTYTDYIFSHPDLARILHRELLAGGTHLKEMVKQHYVTNYAIMREDMRAGARRGELRQLDVDLAPISLIGMIVIFQIAQPVISAVLGRDHYDRRFIKRLSAHTIDLFLNGARSQKVRG